MEQKNQKTLFRSIILAFICAMVIKLFLFDLMIIQGRSMLPTLKPGSLLVVNKAAYGFRLPGLGLYLVRWAMPQPGDVVVFYTPLGEKAVKRCSYVSNEGGGEFFALGDNDLESFDSRSYGLISMDHVLGRVAGE
ncbi:MAG: signal peptidase I [Spirochaetaceae bacterium]|jgi:signal peptidase I|nr:signal peptidase I [Spirochaetaceae bacterium]